MRRSAQASQQEQYGQTDPWLAQFRHFFPQFLCNCHLYACYLNPAAATAARRTARRIRHALPALSGFGWALCTVLLARRPADLHPAGILVAARERK